MADKETIILEIKYKDGKVVTREVKEQTKALKDEEKQVDKVQESFGKLKIAGVAALAAIMALGKKSMDLWIAQEYAVMRVEASLRSAGKYTPELSQHYQDLASSLQRASRYGDEQLLPMISKLITLGGIQEDQMERVMRASMDFAVQTGGLETAVDLLAKAAVGYTSTLSRYGIILDEAIPKSEKFEAALRWIEIRMSGMEEQMTQTTGGAIQQMWNAIGDLMESGFKPFAPLVSNAATEITTFAYGVGGLNEQLFDTANRLDAVALGLIKVDEKIIAMEWAKVARTMMPERMRFEYEKIEWQTGKINLAMARILAGRVAAEQRKIEARPEFELPARPALPGLIAPPAAPMPSGMEIPGAPPTAAADAYIQKMTELEDVLGNITKKQREYSDFTIASLDMMTLGVSNFFQVWASGSMSAAEAMKRSMLSALAQIAIRQGQMYMLSGLAEMALSWGAKGGGAVAAGIALQALGGSMSGFAGRPSGGGGYGGGAGYGGTSYGSQGGSGGGAPQVVVINTGGEGGLDAALGRAGVDRVLRNRIYEMQRSGSLPSG